jgi:hypothetical protein
MHINHLAAKGQVTTRSSVQGLVNCFVVVNKNVMILCLEEQKK